ncbi:hypothetical protein PROFUN_06557 [Planoprotostelium fungivorum]|uniref:Uncharacterized protein n=1 Tax=Planoprotostelium fungivorum TaxID=1890364 RepID=A0A2P6MRU5_9EUKA|nr:hypothetical protein PROFUN_06557 [Planoprotostelium fungivorum]
MSVKENQTASLVRMLNLNKAPESKESLDEPWKILIYDDYCRDILSPLLRVGDLRKHGVTLHLSLHSDRQPVIDVPAVYFVLPTRENLKRIEQDCANHLYDSFHLNFASAVSEALLEELATSALESGSVGQISRVFDQYVNFISLDKDFFTVAQKDSYVVFNDPKISDLQAEQNIDSLVDSLFSVLVTMGVVPIIRCPRNGAAEAIAVRLDNRLTDHLNSMGNLFSENSTGGSAFQRPVLLLLDRNIDLSIMLQHTWNYQPLVHDTLDLTLNRVQVEVTEGEGATRKTEKKSYDLDDHDKFWTENLFTPFHDIAVAINTYLKEYKSTLDDFNKMSGGMDIDNYDESQILGRTKDLGSFVNTIPQLREKKRVMDVHTNIATSLLRSIESRNLDAYYSVEQSIITHSLRDKKEMTNLLAPEHSSTPFDKLRLFLIYYIANHDHLQSAEMDSLLETIKRSGVDTSCLDYLKKNTALSNLVQSTTSQVINSSSVMGGAMKGLFQKVNVESFGLGAAVSDQLGTLFNAGVRAILPTTKELPITRIVDSIMELKPVPQTESYLYLDPKVNKKMRAGGIPRRNTPFKECITFVIGGGNYNEYQNLQEYAKKSMGKRIVYGSTEITSPNHFLEQLNKLVGSAKHEASLAELVIPRRGDSLQIQVSNGPPISDKVAAWPSVLHSRWICSQSIPERQVASCGTAEATILSSLSSPHTMPPRNANNALYFIIALAQFYTILSKYSRSISNKFREQNLTDGRGIINLLPQHPGKADHYLRLMPGSTFNAILQLHSSDLNGVTPHGFKMRFAFLGGKKGGVATVTKVVHHETLAGTNFIHLHFETPILDRGITDEHGRYRCTLLDTTETAVYTFNSPAGSLVFGRKAFNDEMRMFQYLSESRHRHSFGSCPTDSQDESIYEDLWDRLPDIMPAAFFEELQSVYEQNGPHPEDTTKRIKRPQKKKQTKSKAKRPTAKRQRLSIFQRWNTSPLTQISAEEMKTNKKRCKRRRASIEPTVAHPVKEEDWAVTSLPSPRSDYDHFDLSLLFQDNLDGPTITDRFDHSQELLDLIRASPQDWNPSSFYDF